MINKEWNKLRAFDGGQDKAFEELVCQLARAERIEGAVRFYRVAPPDAGKEAYWVLEDGSEYCWQAKFFQKLEPTQWGDIESSFKKALEKHPRLVRYYVVTPLDRADPKVEGANYAMDRWNQNVKKWQAGAREVEFEYWGNHEIFDRLGKVEHQGRYKFWFGGEEFSDQWLADRLKESIASLGVRYTSKLNFELPIAKVFDGIYRDESFKTQFEAAKTAFIKGYSAMVSRQRKQELNVEYLRLKELGGELKGRLDKIKYDEIGSVDFEACSETLNEIDNERFSMKIRLSDMDDRHREGLSALDRKITSGSPYDWERNYLNEFRKSYDPLQKILDSRGTKLFNHPVMLLTGDAGRGKSHLLADVASKRAGQGKPSILLLGQHFINDEPWNQIKKLLGVNCERDEFLGALSAKAESLGHRIPIIIDAINEGEGKNMWRDRLGALIEVVSRFPYLGIVLSVRSSYKQLIIDEYIEDKFITVPHNGFEGFEYEASKMFFDNYRIKQPAIPLLQQEYSNPLFLRLFCEGLQKRGLTEIPNGMVGLTAVFDSFLTAVNARVSSKHSFREQLGIVRKLVGQIASQIADSALTYMPLPEAHSVIAGAARDNFILNPNQFFEDLMSEEVFSEDVFYDPAREPIHGIFVTYEKLGDHLICAHLIEKYVDAKNPSSAFQVNGPLHRLFSDQDSIWENRGVVNAMSIQLPEKVNVELFQCISNHEELEEIADTIIENLIWRRSDTINDHLLDYISEVMEKRPELEGGFLNAVISLSARPNHPLNGDYLHGVLLNMSMADRDAFWTIHIHGQYSGKDNETTIVRRIIDWAWTDDARANISDEAIRLTCQTIGWFLTSTNRKLRDSATKALICLLEERINVLIEVMKAFQDVNDPYIIQRIYAVGYGCAVRTSKVGAIKDLAEYVFEVVFQPEEVVPDILLRDYARGIIEFALQCGHKFDFGAEQITPPYRSSLPTKFPTLSMAEKYRVATDQVMLKPCLKGNNFIVQGMMADYPGGYSDEMGGYFQEELNYWGEVDIKGWINWAIVRIFEDYGYNAEKHGEFDLEIMDRVGYGSSSQKPEERIGKKYQWIAFHEILARVSDNHQLMLRSYGKNPVFEDYEGPWKPSVRDIDPTSTSKGKPTSIPQKEWWNTRRNFKWEPELNADFVRRTDDIPKDEHLVTVIDEEGQEWLVLTNYVEIKDPEGDEDTTSPWRRESLLGLGGYIVRERDYRQVIAGIDNDDIEEDGPLRLFGRSEMYSREYGDSHVKRSRFFNQENLEWDFFNKSQSKVKVYPTAVEYSWESSEDFSMNNGLVYLKPSLTLFGLLNLKHSKVEGHLVGSDGKVQCFDPSAIWDTKSCLLVRKEEFLSKLKSHKLKIFWTIWGHKQVSREKYPSPGNFDRSHISGVIEWNRGKFTSRIGLSGDE